MKFSSLKKQHGAVLAFSLIMLLLLTLAGIRMIQQNKQQLEMANIERVSTQDFSNAEGLLAQVKNIINAYPQHVDPSSDHLAINDSNHQCTPTVNGSTSKQYIGLAGPVTVPNIPTGLSVVITSVRCGPPENFGAEQICSSSNTSGSSVSCNTANSPACVNDNNTINWTNALAIFNTPRTCTYNEDGVCTEYTGDICYQDYDPQVNTLTMSTSGRCPKETYSIKIMSGSRIITESDHVVNCGG